MAKCLGLGDSNAVSGSLRNSTPGNWEALERRT